MALTRNFRETIKDRVEHDPAKLPKSLMRVLGPNGNPQARDLFDIIARLQKRGGIQFEVHPVKD